MDRGGLGFWLLIINFTILWVNIVEWINYGAITVTLL